MELSSRVAVVTGGASGIGRGIAEELVAEGSLVVIADLDAASLDATADEIGATGVVLDVTDAQAVDALARDIVDRHGRVDIVVNNAGVGPRAPLSAMRPADWRWIIDVNLFGVINGVTSFLPYLRSNPEGGHIVNTASMAAWIPPDGLGAYAVTKYGVAGLTEVLRSELKAEGSRVSATLLAPGPVRTNIRDSLRHRPVDLAGALEQFDLADEDEMSQEVWLDPRDVGRIVTRAIRADDAYAITHPQWWPLMADKFDALREAFTRYPQMEGGR